ncbi:MAG: response regulator [Clostridiales bacterium]|jgi:signal transduction histidine kinase/CheY-like chemotaxis protein/HPt (histidine-containing phosphotransfer) domain-containing protein|nr:response regulator [Clostridiales bacterium]
MKIINIFKSTKQQMLVVASFAVMTVVCCLYVNAIVKEQSRANNESSIYVAELEIQNWLSNAETALNDIIILAEEAYAAEGSAANVEQALTQWDIKTESNTDTIKTITAVYGAIGGEYVDGDLWDPDTEYDFYSRPWYAGAKSERGHVSYTDIYTSYFSERPVISISKEFYAADGQAIGVLAVDLDIDYILEYVNTLNISSNGYGLLLNRDLEVLAHHNSEMLGRSFFEFTGSDRVYSELQSKGYVTENRIINYRGQQCVVYMRRLFNEWCLAIITPRGSYFRNVYTITVLMSALAVGLSVILCYVLTRLAKQRDRSELESLSKTTFLARISHEIRTPMNTIAGMNELILRKDIAPDVYENAINIKHASDSLLSIINDLLDYSKLESGNLDIAGSSYLFASLINDVISIIRMRLTDKPVHFIANVDSSIPYELIGDEARLRQVLLNLLSNAVKYTSKGCISITACAEVDEAKGECNLIFEISDSGIGIKEEYQGKIFGNYVNPDIDSSVVIHGAGLGLAITKSLCDAMGGSVSVYSKYGEGSTFTVTIPQKVSNFQAFAQISEPENKDTLVYEPISVYANSVVCSIDNLGISATLATDESMFYNELRQNKYKYVFVSYKVFEIAKDILMRLMLDATLVVLTDYKETVVIPDAKVIAMPAHTLSIADVFNDKSQSYAYNRAKEVTYVSFIAPSARILIVDDIKTNLQVAEGLLSPYKMIVETAMSGAQAIEMCRENNYDIVFMDHMMPEMDGIEATHRIRALDDGSGSHKQIPIIALTANAMAGMKEKFIQNGMDDFIPKPIEVSKLNAILETWIPRGMRREYVADEADEAAAGAEKEIIISGLDTKKGMVMTGGSWKNYIKTLTIYYYDAKQRIEQIGKMLEEGNVTAYTTAVHALKSASGSIGASNVSQMAAALEDAAKSGNMLYVGEHNEEFVRLLKTLTDSLEKVVLGEEQERNAAEENNIPFLYDALCNLRKALDEMDMGEIDDNMAKLDSKDWEKEISAMIENISQNVLLFEYDSAKDIINEIIDKYIE